MQDHVQKGRLRRFARIAHVAARTTGDLLAAEAKKRLLKSEEEHAEQLLQPTAHRLVKVLGELKGAATKIGQFVSLVDQDTFPEEARRILARLMSQTPHRMAYEAAAAMVARELGAPPEELFDAFSQEPFASASMGQVHAARMPDGREVVVKIQFPGVEGSIESDLKNVGVLAKGLSLAGSALDGREYVEEIAETLRRELDYFEEHRQLEAYRAAVQPWERIVVPQVVEERSARRVITLERLMGPTVLEFAQDPESPAERRYDVACRLLEAVYGPFLRERLIHADPHPGNYIVLPEGRLGVLDFGATKRLSLHFGLAYWHLIARTLAGECVKIAPLLTLAGFQLTGESGATEAWLRGLADIVERPVHASEYDWDRCRIAADCKDLIARNVTMAIRCRAPREGVMFYRAVAGLAGDFRMLKARGDFRAPSLRLVAEALRVVSPDMRRAASELFGSEAVVELLRRAG